MSEAEFKTKVNPNAAPMFIVGADDRPTDNRIVAIALGFRGELKVGDREFSSPILAHEAIVLRHFYEARAGSGTVAVKASWPPGLARERGLTHSDLAAEVKRLRETFITARQGGNVIKSFDIFFGTEPADQLKRLHAVMREQYEAWKALLAKAHNRLEGDLSGLHAEVKRSMACELITEREVEDLIAIADPSRRASADMQLAEIKLSDLTLTGDAAVEQAIPKPIDDVKAAAEAAADAEDTASLGERVADVLNSNGVEAQKALAVGALVEQYGAKVSHEDLVRVLGSKTQADQARRLINDTAKKG